MTMVLSKKMSEFLGNLSPRENSVQKNAFARLEEMDFPTTRDEYWKYTRLGKISNSQFAINEATGADLDVAKHIVAPHYLVIENGTVRADLSKIENTAYEVNYETIETGTALNTFGNDADIFNTINSAFTQQIITINIAAKAELKEGFQLIFIGHSEKAMANHRIEINAGKFSKGNIIYTFVSNDENAQFDNMLTSAKVAENGHLTIDKVQATNAANLSVSTEEIEQGPNSTFRINTLSLGGLLQRNNINILVAGENCETFMNGIAVTKGKQHIDNHTFVDHSVPNCYSNENYKYVLDDQSTGVFNGRVIVQKDAQVINAYQNNGNILLSEEASINSKPELEIYADDVKCSHGSTTGQLDEDALFYLQARGISKPKARKLLVRAFVGEILEAVENESVRTYAEQILTTQHGWKFD